MNDNITIPDSNITTNLSFRSLVIMNMQQLTNFPYIEKDFDALTDYELLCLVVKYLNDVITNQNEQNASITRVYESFLALQNYVNNTKDDLVDAFNTLDNYVRYYFDNLDVQDEINNKLDAMADAGTLQEIIADYLNSKAIFGYDNVQSMVSATNLINGSYAKTLGYYTKNDGGSGLYKIRNVTNDDVVDDAFIIEMENDNLVAELIIENNSVNIKTLGARSQDTSDNKYDIKQYIEKYITYIASQPNRCRLYIPSGIWYSSPLEITNTNGFDIYGDFGYFNYSLDSTVITSLNNNQPYILKLGTNTGTYLKNWNLENILFSSYDYTYRSNENDFYISTPKTITEQAVNMVYAIHGKMSNILFINLIGQALKISACWENIFDYLVFRYVSNPTGSILCFGSDLTYGEYASVSSSDFTRLYFESTHGDLIEFKHKCNFSNNHIGVINFEPNQYNYDSLFEYTTINADGSNIPAGVKHHYILKLSENGSNMVGNKIESIELNSFSNTFYTFNNNSYMYDSIIYTPGAYFFLGLIIDSINSTETRKDIVIYKNESSNTPNEGSFLVINGLAMYSNYNFVFDLNKCFSCIKCRGELYGNNKLVPKINNNITPFYEVLSRIQNKPIVSNPDSITPLRLCCELERYNGSLWNGRFINTGTKLCIRAKIPNGVTYTFRLQNEDASYTQNLTMVGTGTFTWYTLELNEHHNTYGMQLNFKSGAGENPAGVLLDCFTFKD